MLKNLTCNTDAPVDNSIMNTQNHLKEVALLKAIRLYGSADKMAQSIGASRSQLNNWLNRGDRVPYQYAIVILDYILVLISDIVT